MKRSGFIAKIIIGLMLLLVSACGKSVPPITVEVSPETAQVRVNQTQQFTATVTRTTSASVVWSVNDVTSGNSTLGTITGEGLYTAPANVPDPATVTVKATSQEDTSKSDTAAVTIEEEIITKNILCLGDSITEGYPYSGSENTYPAKLQSRLNSAYGANQYQVVNHGVSGYRADQVLSAMQSNNWLAQTNPTYVLLLVGGNDLLQEVSDPPTNLIDVVNQTISEIQSIVNLAKNHTNPDGSHPKVIVSKTLPTTDSLTSSAANYFNNSLGNQLSGHTLWLTTNWSDFYETSSGHALSSLMADNVHPNIEGYSVMAENWFDAISSLL